MSLGSPPTPRALDAGDEAGFTSGELTGDPLLRHCHGRDTAETWPRDGRDMAETWPRHGTCPAVPRRRPTPLLAAGAGDEETVEPTSEDFSGFVFKLQANTDPKHRDRIAYVRVCSGRFEKGLKVKHSRLRGQQLTLAQAQTLLGAERSTLDGTSYPGDVVGIPFSPGQMAIGDTLYTGSRRISFAKIPSFSPEIFARCINPTPSKREPHLLPDPPPPLS